MRLDNVDGFSFDFSDALDAFVFDEKDRFKPTFHGQPMKAVDIVVELADAYLYVEIKDFYDPVVNLEKWNQHFPKWPAGRTTAGAK